MKKITLSYCGMAGEGPTVKEAKQDAARKIEAVLSACYQPRIVIWGDKLALIWNTPQGVVSAYVENKVGAKIQGTCHHCRGTDMNKAEQSAKLNLAMNCADIESDSIPEVIADNPNSIASFLSWIGFQRAYRQAVKDGLDNHGAHAWACHNSIRFTPDLLAA